MHHQHQQQPDGRKQPGGAGRCAGGYVLDSCQQCRRDACGWRLMALRIKGNATDAGLNAAPRPESLECATAETAVGAEEQRSGGRHKGRRRRGEEKDGHEQQPTGPRESGNNKIDAHTWSRHGQTSRFDPGQEPARPKPGAVSQPCSPLLRSRTCQPGTWGAHVR
jgi:hypothetical protein